MRRNLSYLFLGSLLILFGVLWGGNSMGLWNFNVFFPGWWALILIVMPIFGMIQHGVKGFDIVILFIGIVLLLSSLDILDWESVKTLFFPALLILIGLIVVFSIFRNKQPKGLDEEAMANISTVFSDCKRNFDHQSYHGGRVESVFGGVELDLRSAVIEEDIYINASAIFGSAKIWFPPNVRVIPDDASVFGGLKDKTLPNSAVNVPEVHIHCAAIFGGIDLY